MTSLLLLAVVLAAAPGTPAPAPPAAAAPAAPTDEALAEYRVGAGDILDIVVLDNPELSRSAVVQTNGNLSLPLVGEVPVLTLTVVDVKNRLTTRYASYLVDPQVEVRVKEYQSQFVTVIGEVNTPGRKALRGKTRLLDVLLDAGGFTANASGEVTLSRRDGTFASGDKALRLRLGRTQLNAQDQANLELPLRNGDFITALPKYYVTVEGEVARPGRYVIEPDLTVSGAISLAGGLSRYGSHKLKVRRTHPADGRTEILRVDLKEIRKGEEPDLAMQANDVVTVERSLF